MLRYKRWLALRRSWPHTNGVRIVLLLLLCVPAHMRRMAGFLLILEPFETDNATVPNPVFHFTSVALLDSSAAECLMAIQMSGSIDRDQACV